MKRRKAEHYDLRFAIELLRFTATVWDGPAPKWSNSSPEYRRGGYVALTSVIEALEKFLPRKPAAARRKEKD